MSQEQLDAAWDLVPMLRMTITIIAGGFILSRLMSRFATRRRTSVFIGLAYSAVLLILFWIPQELSGTFAYLAALAAVILCSAVFEKGRSRLLLVLLGCAFYAVRLTSGSLANAVHASLFAAFVDIPQPSPEIHLIRYSLCAAAAASCAVLMLFAAASVISRTWPRNHLHLTLREFLLLLIPPAATILVSEGLYYFRQLIDYRTEYLRAEWICAVLMIFLFGTILGTMVLSAKVAEQQDRKNALEMLSVQTESLGQYVGELEALYAHMRSFRHDMANHLETLAGLESAGDRKAAAEYAKSLRLRIGEVLPEVSTGNPVTDVILSSQKKQAENSGIRFESTFRFPPSSQIDPLELGVILHNAGSNAIEAASSCSDPFVEVHSFVHHRMYVLEYVNSFDGCLCLGPGGMPVSRKNNPAGHGIGLQNIRAAAERCGGECSYECGAGTFRLTVLLRC